MEPQDRPIILPDFAIESPPVQWQPLCSFYFPGSSSDIRSIGEDGALSYNPSLQRVDERVAHMGMDPVHVC
jgi:hypothetical protein